MIPLRRSLSKSIRRDQPILLFSVYLGCSHSARISAVSCFKCGSDLSNETHQPPSLKSYTLRCISFQDDDVFQSAELDCAQALKVINEYITAIVNKLKVRMRRTNSSTSSLAT